jgi:micrococcal nuclease
MSFKICKFLLILSIYYTPLLSLVKWESKKSLSFSIVKLIRVVDGDSIIVSKNGQYLKIRLIYIDAPESKQVAMDHWTEVGKISKSILVELLAGQKWIKIKIHKKDIYHRFLSEVYNGEGVNINLKMIQLGGAMIYKFAQFSKRQTRLDYSWAFEKALHNKLGIWAYGGVQNAYYFRQLIKK